VKITLFTSNSPRHLSLAEGLSAIADEVFVVHECVTAFPGQVEDFFRRSEVMQRYFGRVVAAEQTVFGQARFLPDNVRQLPLRMGDLSLMPMERLGAALESDLFVVFGASYIRGPLIDHLVSRDALNIHMGLSPWYRGSSCNFWALNDGRPDLVGATIHRLSRGLDSGDMLYHARPPIEAVDPFVFGMKAVKAAHDSLIERIASGEIAAMAPVVQDRGQELRYTRNRDFDDAAAEAYLAAAPTPEGLKRVLETAPPMPFLRLHQPAPLDS
jgi:hypothetical protein